MIKTEENFSSVPQFILIFKLKKTKEWRIENENGDDDLYHFMNERNFFIIQ